VAGERYRILLVSSSGGVFQDILAMRCWWEQHHRAWAVVRAADTVSVLGEEHVHWVPEIRGKDLLGCATALPGAFRILRKERPQLLLSAGSGAAVPFFVAARLAGIPAIWLSTFNLVGTPGLAARVCAPLASAVVLQRATTGARHRRAVLLGELY
jgi:hypothetical protein